MTAKPVAVLVLIGLWLGQPSIAMARVQPCPPLARQADDGCARFAEPLREPSTGQPVMPWR